MDYLAYALAFMRQDPDIIFIGEWRKMVELTETLLYASETGHLVYSTLHASRVVSVPNLLVNQYKLKKDDIANNVNILINQRLIKRVCPHCSTTEIITKDKLEDYGLNQIKFIDKEKLLKMVGEESRVVNDEGCSHCLIFHPVNGQRLAGGYLGRTVLYEFLAYTYDIRILASETTNAIDIEKALISESEKGRAKTYIDITKKKVLDGQLDLKTALSALKG
jgi:general secretion pathway protein E